MTRVAEQERATYLGYGLLISERKVAVSTPDGRRIGEERSLSAARRVVKGYRRAVKAGQP